MALGYDPNAKRDSRITFRLPRTLHKLVEEDAETIEASVSDTLVFILNQWFYRRPEGDADEIFREIDELIGSLRRKQSGANPGMSDKEFRG